MNAAENGHLECVKTLAPLEKGMKNNDGWAVKAHASYNNHPDVATYLSQFPRERPRHASRHLDASRRNENRQTASFSQQNAFARMRAAK